MEKISAAITAIGGYVPEYKLTNSELETMVDTNDEWIRSRTGIEERRILKGDGLGSSYMGAEAVKQLCSKRGISPLEIDCLICATVTPDMQFPAMPFAQVSQDCLRQVSRISLTGKNYCSFFILVSLQVLFCAG